MCACVCMCMYVRERGTSVCMQGKGQHRVSFSISFLIFLRPGLSLNLRFSCLAILVGQQAPGIRLFLTTTPQSAKVRENTNSCFFGGMNSGPQTVMCVASMLQSEPFSPNCLIWFLKIIYALKRVSTMCPL